VSNKDLAFLETLEAVIVDRIANPDGNSYTASLAASGRHGRVVARLQERHTSSP
jgi:phosphoribosyl-ATP pyrophosphohydrolase